MATQKPDLTRVWANGAPTGNVVDPDETTPGKVNAGWRAEVPPFEHFNYLQKWFSQGLAYNNEQGINEWDANTTYPVDALVKASDGNLYSSLTSNQGETPISNTSAWLSCELQTIARSLNVLDSDVIYDTDTLTTIPAYIYSSSQQKTYSVPSEAKGKTITGVVDNVLEAEGGSYTLSQVTVENTSITFKNDSFGSAVENMIAGRIKGVASVTHTIGDIYRTNGNSWVVDSTPVTSLANFSSLNLDNEAYITDEAFGDAPFDGVANNDAQMLAALATNKPVVIPAKTKVLLQTPIVRNAAIQIRGLSSTTSEIRNDVADGETLFSQAGGGSKHLSLSNFVIRNPNKRKNRFASSVLNVLECTAKDLVFWDSYSGLYLEDQWVSPSVDNVIFRSLGFTSAELEEATCIGTLNCNTISLSNVSMTGGWGKGAHLVAGSNSGNFSVNLRNVTGQGINGSSKAIGKPIVIEGGNAISLDTIYVEKTRELESIVISDAQAVDLKAVHMVQGSVILNNCKSKLSSSTNYVVYAGDIAGVSSIQVNGGVCEVSNVVNNGDYEYRYEVGDASGTIIGSSKLAIKNTVPLMNSGVVDSASVVSNKRLQELGHAGAYTVTTSDTGGGVKISIPSAVANLGIGTKFIISALVRIKSGDISVKASKIIGFGASQRYPVLHTRSTSSSEFVEVSFYSKVSADGAACQFISDGVGEFDIIPMSYMGW